MKDNFYGIGFFGIFGLAALILGIVVFVNSRTSNTGDKDRMSLYGGLAVGAGGALLLNALGLGLSMKSFGGLGMAISAAMIGYGIYLVVTKTSLPGVSSNDSLFIGSLLIAVGAITVLTSLGVIVKA